MQNCILRTKVHCFNSEKVSISTSKTLALATRKIRAAANLSRSVQQNAQILQNFQMISLTGRNLLHFPNIECGDISHFITEPYHRPYIGGGKVAGARQGRIMGPLLHFKRSWVCIIEFSTFFLFNSIPRIGGCTHLAPTYRWL